MGIILMVNQEGRNCCSMVENILILLLPPQGKLIISVLMNGEDLLVILRPQFMMQFFTAKTPQVCLSVSLSLSHFNFIFLIISPNILKFVEINLLNYHKYYIFLGFLTVGSDEIVESKTKVKIFIVTQKMIFLVRMRPLLGETKIRVLRRI